MKKFQKLTLVAFLGLLLGSFSSCTKDLEDRMDKVEKDVSQLITDVASLKTTLKDLSEKANLTMSASQAADGTITLITKNPDYNFTFKGADGKGSVVSIKKDTPAVGKTSILIEGDPNSPYVFTTDVAVPSSVTGIVLVSGPGSDDVEEINVYETKSFTVNVYLNTNDGKPVTVTADNFTVIEPKTRAAESEIIVSPTFSVTKAEQIGTTNEYQLTIKAASIGEVSPFPFIQLRLNNPAQSISSKIAVEIMDVPSFSGMTYAIGTAQADDYGTTLANNNFGTDVVFNIDGTLQPTTRTINVGIDAADSPLANVEFVDNLTLTLYEQKGVATWPTAISYTDDMDMDANDLVTTNLNTFLTTNAADIKVVDGIATLSVVDGKYVIAIDAKVAAGTMEDNATKNYVAILRGKSFSDNGSYVIASAKYAVTKRPGINMAQDLKFVPTTTTEVTQGVYTFTQTYGVKTYATLTGVAGAQPDNTAANNVITITNAQGNVIPDSKTSRSVSLYLDEQGYLKYDITIGSNLPAGVYTIELAHTYAAGKTINFIHKATVTRPVETATLPAVTTANATAGWILSNGKDYVFNSIKPLNDRTAAPEVSVVLTMGTASFAGVTVTNTPALTAGTNYKVFYRLYTTNGVTKTYIDGLTDATTYAFTATPVTSYTAVKTDSELDTPASITSAKILMDTKYGVDAVIAYASGLQTVLTDISTVTYATTPIEGFMVASKVGPFMTELAREFTLGGTTTYDLSYTVEGSKSFFLGNKALFTANWASAVNTTVDPSNRCIDELAYSIGALSPDDQAKLVVIAGGAAAGKTTIIGFGADGNVQDLANSVLEVAPTAQDARLNATLKLFTANVTDNKLTGKVTQDLTISAKDVWGRTTTHVIKVTINPATPVL